MLDGRESRMLERDFRMDSMFDVVLSGVEIDGFGWHTIYTREWVLS